MKVLLSRTDLKAFPSLCSGDSRKFFCAKKIINNWNNITYIYVSMSLLISKNEMKYMRIANDEKIFLLKITSIDKKIVG